MNSNADVQESETEQKEEEKIKPKRDALLSRHPPPPPPHIMTHKMHRRLRSDDHQSLQGATSSGRERGWAAT